MQKVTAENGIVHNFPDEATPEQIAKALGARVASTSGKETQTTPAMPSVSPAVSTNAAPAPNTTSPEQADQEARLQAALGTDPMAPGTSGGDTTPDPALASAGKFVKEEGPAIAGGLATGVAAAAAGTGLAATVGLVGLGGAAGEAYKQIGQHLSGSLSAPQTSLEAAKRIAQAGIEQGGMEAFGGLAAKGVGKILAPFKNKLLEGAGEAAAYFKDKIQPLVFMPAEATEARALDLMHNVAEASIIGGASISQFKTQRLKFFDDFADSMIDQFGSRTDPTQLGELFVGAITEKRNLHRAAANVMYNTVEEMIGTRLVEKEIKSQVAGSILDASGKPTMREVVTRTLVPESTVNISTGPLKEFAAKTQLRAADLNGIEAKNAGDDLMQAVMDLPDTVTFDVMKELRSRLISRVDEFSVLNKKAPAIGKANKLLGIAHDAITNTLEVQAPQALEAWEAANTFYKAGEQRFNSTMIRRLMKFADDTGTGGEMIAPAIFKPGQVSRVKAVKDALDPPEMQKLQGFFMQHVLSKATTSDQSLSGNALLNMIEGKPNSFGMPMLKEMFSDAQITALKNLGKGLQIAQKGQGEGTGRMLVQLSQGGAIGSLAMGQFEVPAATLLLGPVVLSKAMLSPPIAKWLTTGVTMPANSQYASGVLARLIGSTGELMMEREVK